MAQRFRIPVPSRSVTASAAVGLSLLTLLIGAGCSAPPPDSRSAAADATGGLAEPPDVAPDFTLNDLDGNPYRLAETAGTVRLIDFWATWCPPCREEIPMLQRLHETYGEQGLTVLAISDESAEVVRDFVQDKGIAYTNLIDPGEVAEEYVVLGLPTGFLIDRDGRIVERFIGPKPGKVLERRIRELLELPPET